MPDKACSVCKEVKPIGSFYKDKNRADGHLGYCKACHKKAAEAREARKAAMADAPEAPKPTETKTCNKCGETKTVDNFHKDCTKKDGYHNCCKGCRSTKKDPEEEPEVEPPTEKRCRLCEVVKSIDNFRRREASADGFRNECKKCLDEKYPPKKKEREPEKEYPCNTCKEVKKGSEFYNTASGMCASCEGKRMHEYRKTLDGALRELVGSAKSNSKTKKGEASKYEIDFEYVKGLYEQQEGRCYYSGIEMTTSGQFKMSLERLDNKKGYIKENVAIVCLEFNNQMHWSREKVKEMVNILDKNIEENIVDFSDITVDYDDKPRTKLYNLANSAKHRAIDKTSSGRDMGEYNLDVEFMMEMFNEQKGLCAYSGLPLRFGKRDETNWLVSLERIDVHKGYTKDNVCLICLEFNSTDRTVNKTYKSETSTGWSKAKFEFFLNTVRSKIINA